METENIFFAGEKINSSRKGGIFGEGKYVYLRRRRLTEKEKEDHLQESGPSG